METFEMEETSGTTETATDSEQNNEMEATITSTTVDSATAAANNNNSSSTGQNGSKQETKKEEEQQQQQQPPHEPTAIVPQLPDSNITFGDLEIAIRVLNAVAKLHPKKQKQQQKQQQQQQKKRKQQQNNTETTNDSDEKKKNGSEDGENNDGNGNATAKVNTNNNSTDDKKQPETELSLDDTYKHSNLRLLRKALAGCLEVHQLTMFQGKNELDHYNEVVALRSLKRQKVAERDLNRKYIETTQLRKGRIEKLKELQNQHLDAQQHEEAAKLNAAIEYMIPDGHVETTTTTTTPKLLTNQTSEMETNDTKDNNTATAAASEQNETQQSSKITTTVQQQSKGGEDEEKHLPKFRSCYVCKVRFRQLHAFYDQLCPDCAKLNFEKRHQTADMTGRVAVLTGARVKIGLQVGLKLLRAGCTVVATTRFPNGAVQAYRRQSDFNEWKDRLHVFGLDLRDVTGLEAFTRFLKVKFGQQGIDILINNACQTVRRPVGYYVPLVQQEQSLWQTSDSTHKSILHECLEFERVRRRLQLDHNNHSSDHHQHPQNSILPPPPTTSSSSTTEQPEKSLLAATMQMDEIVLEEKMNIDDGQAAPVSSSTVEAIVPVASNSTDKDAAALVTTATTTPFESTGVSHSAAMSQMVVLPEDAGVSDDILPQGVTDINGHQLDLRTTNSWRLKLEEVSTPEVMECMFINAIAPFVLNSRLKPLMCIPADDDDEEKGTENTNNTENGKESNCNGGRRRRRPDRYIVNVSAMEGKFYRYKMPNHPHTNMAKAALNMMTRTSAEDFAKRHRIFMNSVDTGWINDENPLERAKKTMETNKFQTPIDEIDAAARILDPIFTGVNQDLTEADKAEDGVSAGGKGDKKGGKAGSHKCSKDYGKFLKDYRETEW